MRVAIVHDMTVGYAGSERVLEQMLAVFPKADLFTVVDFIPQKERAFLSGRIPKTSFIQKMPLAQSKYRLYLPLMPLAVEQFDLLGYNLIISSSHAVAKGVIVGPDQLHISYVHSPMRYAWDLQHQYLAESNLGRGIRSWLARGLLHYLRLWDHRTANGVDIFIANSRFIARRIQKTYRRESTVIHPPVDVESFVPGLEKQDFYFTSSRLVPYKRIDLIVEAFSQMPEKQLIVIGDGPEMPKVRAKAGSNVKLLGYQPFVVLREHLQKARAFIFAAEEDFGIAPVEAMACGTPVIAYGKGGVLETVIEGTTGLFFKEQTPDAIAQAVQRFETATLDPQSIRTQAQTFSVERFRREFRTLVEAEWAKFRSIG